MLNTLNKLSAEKLAVVNPIIDDLVDDVRETVARIEGDKLITSKHNYSRYMAVLSGMLDAFDADLNAEQRADLVQVFGCALERAGGNAAGIDAAANLITGG